MRLIIFLIILSHNTLVLSEERRESGDFNFDGHEDYRIFVMPNGKTTIWEYYLFNPVAKKFEESESLFSLSNPIFDSESKTVKTYMPGGHSGKIYVSEIYTWKSRSLVLMKIEKQDWIKKINSYIRVTVERVDGQMQVTNIEPTK